MTANRLKVGIFIPCCIDQFSVQTGKNMVNLLQRIGCMCDYPVEQTCCGQELYLNGDRESARMLGERMIDMFLPYDYVVTCSSGCVAYMKKKFDDLFRNSSRHNEFPKFINKLYDITDFLVNVVHYTPEGVTFPYRVAFMDHCRTLHDYGLSEEPRQLLRAISDIDLVEVSNGGVCCGYGGTFANFFEPVSTEMVRQKVDSYVNAGVQYIVSTEPTCLMHTQSYIDKAGINIQCRHIVDILAS